MSPCPIMLMLTIAVACAAPAQPAEAERGEGGRLDAYTKRLADHGFAGVVLVARDGRPVLAKGYGLANRETGRPYTPDTVVSLGSITKQFTAAAILKLESQGKLTVQDPIGRFFKDVPADKAGITLHHLLTHSAGLESDFGDDFDPISRDEIIRRALHSRLRSAPGQRYHYSNAGYSLLAAIVELVSGQGYEAYLQEHLFRPAGMTRTGYRLPRWRPEDVAQGYRRGRHWGTILERPWAADGPYWMLRGNGGIHSTAADMLRWHLALQGDAVLPAAQREKLFTPYVREGLASSHYAYGWAVAKTRRGTRVIQHNGGDGIFSADCKRYPDDGVFIFVASNDADTPAWKVSGWLSALLFGGDAPAVPAVVAADAGLLDRLAGMYALATGGKLTVAVETGWLRIGGEGADALSLLSSGSTTPSPRLTGASARTAAILEAAGRGDYAPLHKALGDGRPLERVTANQKRMRQQWEAAHGPYRGFDVLGSTASGMFTETFVRLRFASGSVLFSYGWEGTQLGNLAPATAPPAARTYRPVSPTEFASFNFGTGRTTTIRFTLDPHGMPRALTLQARDGPVTASRSKA